MQCKKYAYNTEQITAEVMQGTFTEMHGSRIAGTGDMTIPLQFAPLYDGQVVFMWSDCLLNLGTDFLVGNMVLYEMYNILW